MTPDIHRTLGNLDAKVDLLLKFHSEAKEERDKDRERITKLEHEATGLKAKAGLIAMIVSAVPFVFDAWFKIRS